MKKLMIAAAIVCAAAFSQAATCGWSTSSALKVMPKATIDAGLSAGTYDVGSGYNATLAEANYSGTFAYILTMTQGATTKTFEGTLAKNAGLSNLSKVSLELSDDFFDKDLDYSYTLTYTGTIKDGKGAEWALTSDEVKGAFHSNPTGDITFESGVATKWTVAAVPEPTSGLLLLLGVAGLALRRRRA